MSPNSARMEEACESTEIADPVELVVSSPQAVEVAESVGSEEPSLIKGLMQRIGAFGRANRPVPITNVPTSSIQGSNL